ncbi:MAG: HAD-IIB family hydrolase [Gemmatimonadota bacterium]
MGKKTALLASDMDGTVIPLEEGPERDAEVAEFRKAVEASDDLTLAYVTGRGFDLARKGMRQFKLPLPDYLVCDVGTSVYHRVSGEFHEDPEYARRMRRAMGELNFAHVREFLKPVDHLLLLQPEERQTEFKLSYHLPHEEDHAAIVELVRGHLEELGGSVQAVYSVGAPSGRGLLDLLPMGAAKDFAVHYLQEVTGVDDSHLVYAGDSGNDLAVMLAGFKAVVVANAGADLRDGLVERMEDEALAARIHFSAYRYSRGVLDGCRHFGIL